jgi:peptide/nickel transport system ATP-binding protein
MDPARRRTEPPLKGDPPNPINPPSGCRFRTRCAIARTICASKSPELHYLDRSHEAACHAVVPDSGFAQSDRMVA